METINFHGQQLYVGTSTEGTRVVAVRPICENIGVDFPGQYRKITADAKFSHCDIAMTGSDGKTYRMFCLQVSQLNGWLYGINSRKVAPECQESLLRYQREAQEILFRYFMPQGGTNEEIFALMADMRKEFRQDISSLRQSLEQMRGDLDETQTLVGMFCLDDDETEIRSLVQEVKTNLGLSKAAIIGQVRALTGMSKIYETCNPILVKNVLRNLLGRGVFGSVSQ